MSTLLLEYWTENQDLCIYAEAGDFEKEVTLQGQAPAVIAQFTTIYAILENKEEEKEQKLQEAILLLSDRLLAPFTKQLTECSAVRFVIYDDLVRCAFDLLLFEGRFLFLQRSVCYQVAEGRGEDDARLTVESALLIADLTADPEEACKEVSRRIPESFYARMQDANMGMIKEAADQVDALIVSAHGELDDDNGGGVYLNDKLIGSQLIGKLEAWIVYFDACQQGANWDYLQAFQEESDIQFFLAPIISNDAGDSSTKTMIWFFAAVLEHGNPIRALFETRKRLFEFYTVKERLSLITSLNKAFAFRIYEFVDGEEE